MSFFTDPFLQGKDANPEERAKALERAQAFIKEKDYGPNTHVRRQTTGKKNKCNSAPLPPYPPPTLAIFP